MEQAIVVGGGAVGMATALRLQEVGLSVTVVDEPSPQRPASWGNAGHIAVEQIAPLASFSVMRQAPRRLLTIEGGLSLPLTAAASWLPFSLRLMAAALPRRHDAGKTALKMLLADAMPAWVRLTEQLGRQDLIHRTGHYIAWCTPGTAAAGKKHWFGTDVGTALVRNVTPDELHQLQSLTSRQIADAVHCDGTGQIHDPDAVFDTIHTHFLHNGGSFIPARVRALPLDRDRVSVELEDGRKLNADKVVVAAGIAAKPLMTQLGYHVPMIAERGYHIQFAAGGWPANLPPVVFEDYAMILTRFADTVRAAGYVEYATPGRRADPRKWEQLLRNVRDIGFNLDRPVSEWMGSRPTLPDYLPAIGQSRRATNLFYGFGHQHLGLTLAPVTAEILADLVLGNKPAVSATPFDLERF